MNIQLVGATGTDAPARRQSAGGYVLFEHLSKVIGQMVGIFN